MLVSSLHNDVGQRRALGQDEILVGDLERQRLSQVHDAQRSTVRGGNLQGIRVQAHAEVECCHLLVVRVNLHQQAVFIVFFGGCDHILVVGDGSLLGHQVLFIGGQAALVFFLQLCETALHRPVAVRPKQGGQDQRDGHHQLPAVQDGDDKLLQGQLNVFHRVVSFV